MASWNSASARLGLAQPPDAIARMPAAAAAAASVDRPHLMNTSTGGADSTSVLDDAGAEAVEQLLRPSQRIGQLAVRSLEALAELMRALEVPGQLVFERARSLLVPVESDERISPHLITPHVARH